MSDIIKRALERLSLGRAYVLSRADYYASTLLEMSVEIVDKPGVTMGITRGLVLYVNGNWLLTDPAMQSDAVVGACLVHECEHPLRGLDRLEALPNGQLANIAGDEAINYNLQEENWSLPPWVVYPSTFGHPPNLTLEQYYALLQQTMHEEQKSLQQLMDKAPGAGAGAGTKRTKEKKPSQPPDSWVPKIGSGGCGSGGGNPIDENLEAELDAAMGKSPAEVESARRQTFDAIESALTASGRGDIPKRFKELIKLRYKKPVVNWRQALRHVLQRAVQITSGASDYSMLRPSVGSQLVGYFGPGLIDRKIDVVIVEDTSGSMGEEQLVQAREEAYQLMRKVGIEEATLIQADAAVAHVQQHVRLRNLPKIQYHGRGGTSFEPAFTYIKKHLPRTSLVVYFTDGDGRAPIKKPKGFETVWCVVRTPYARRPAHWGHVVVCDRSQQLRNPIT